VTRASAHNASLRTWAVIGTAILATAGCGQRDEPLGCAELVVTCPKGADPQQWWLARSLPADMPSSTEGLRGQDGECGSWLAFITPGATASYDNIDLGNQTGEMRLRVLVAADDLLTTGGTLSLFADQDPDDPMATPVRKCEIGTTGGWFSWLVVDCGPIALTGRHNLVFKFDGTAQYVFNFAAFGVARSGAPDCTVDGPKK
jgi:Carbohydrate binding module (family 6)